MSFSGRWINFEEVHAAPPPRQRPFPVWVGGNGAAGRRRAAALGTGWHPLFPTPEAYASGREDIVARRSGWRERPNRSPGPISTALVKVVLDGHPPAGFAGYAGQADIPEEFGYAPAPPADAVGATAVCRDARGDRRGHRGLPRCRRVAVHPAGLGRRRGIRRRRLRRRAGAFRHSCPTRGRSFAAGADGDGVAFVRRVVTGHDAAGRAVFLSDGVPPKTIDRGVAGGERGAGPSRTAGRRDRWWRFARPGFSAPSAGGRRHRAA